MLLQTSSAEAEKTRHPINVHGQTYYISDYMGRAPVNGGYVEGYEKHDNPLPQGFLVEQPPGSATPPHFHEANQFQVVVAGGGRIGKHDTPPLSVHYANAHTPYGPVCAGADGLFYFTLRSSWDPGAKYLPDAKDKLRKGNQRARYGGAALTDGATLAALGGASSVVLMAPEPDGLAAWLYRTGAGGRLVLPAPAGSGGQYHMVVGGAALRDGASLTAWSCLFVTPDEPALAIDAGPAGLELLVMQYPDIPARC